MFLNSCRFLFENWFIVIDKNEADTERRKFNFYRKTILLAYSIQYTETYETGLLKSLIES